MYLRPSRLGIPPQLGISGGRPNPRKLSEASAMMTPPMLIEKKMMIGAIILKWGQAVRQESWQEIESESLLLGKAVTTRRVPES